MAVLLAGYASDAESAETPSDHEDDMGDMPVVPGDPLVEGVMQPEANEHNAASSSQDEKDDGDNDHEASSGGVHSDDISSVVVTEDSEEESDKWVTIWSKAAEKKVQVRAPKRLQAISGLGEHTTLAALRAHVRSLVPMQVGKAKLQEHSAKKSFQVTVGDLPSETFSWGALTSAYQDRTEAWLGAINFVRERVELHGYTVPTPAASSVSVLDAAVTDAAAEGISTILAP